MRAKPLFKTRFVVRTSVSKSDGDHWIGGMGEYQGAECPLCHVPLLLLLDVNCQDPVLQKASRGKLRPLKRLPLYHCLRCASELSYSVDEREIRILHRRYGNAENGPPYDGFPEAFPRRPATLDSSVPAGLPKVIGKWNPDIDLRGDRLSKSERRLLEDYFGHPIFIPRFMYHHQLGGESLFDNWDESAFPCPNKNCPGGFWDAVVKRSRPMRFLAGLLNDPPGGLPMIEPLDEKTQSNWNYFMSVYFQICDKCLTITTFSASD
jgi:hypothetical protein